MKATGVYLYGDNQDHFIIIKQVKSKTVIYPAMVFELYLILNDI